MKLLKPLVQRVARPVEGGRKKRRQEGRLATSLTTPKLFPEVADGVACNGLGDCVSLLREPDAANPHVRFDERGVETEAWRDFQGTDRRKGRQQLGSPYTTAPHLDSTHLPKNNSLWASKTGNSGRTESVSCDLDRSGVSGQPLPTGGL